MPLANMQTPIKRREGPVWRGPESTDEQGGVTWSLLRRFLEDRERFRIYAMEGWKGADNFNHRLEYGNMWHICEENDLICLQYGHREHDWETPLKAYRDKLIKRYPLAQEQIDHWYCVCRTQFPIYVEYWSKHPDMVARTPLLSEQVFSVAYTLPSGRTVQLRGKWDSVDLVDGKVWLQENKTKGEVEEEDIARQLKFDGQTMLYLAALQEEQERLDDSTVRTRLSYQEGQYRIKYPIAGVRYNVVRRPLSGGKGSIVRYKATKNKPEETKDHYYDRLRQIIDGTGEDAPGPSHFFHRWDVGISEQDIIRFRRESLDPILEQLCVWYEVMKVYTYSQNVKHAPLNNIHWRIPNGVRDILNTEYENYLETGSTIGLRRVENLFEELV